MSSVFVCSSFTRLMTGSEYMRLHMIQLFQLYSRRLSKPSVIGCGTLRLYRIKLFLIEEFRIIGFYLYHVTSIRPSNSRGASG